MGKSILVVVGDSLQRLRLALGLPFRLPAGALDEFLKMDPEGPLPAASKAKKLKLVSEGQQMMNSLGADLLGKSPYYMAGLLPTRCEPMRSAEA